MREIQIEARRKKDRKREAVRGKRRLDLGEDVGIRLAHSAGRQPRNISASCITVSACKFCQSLGHTVGILEVIL